MEFVTELKPNQMGRDHFRAIGIPLVISFLYYVFLYFQTFIKETNDENSIGLTYALKGHIYGSASPFNLLIGANFFILSFLTIWVAMRTINLGGTIGNVGISGIIFGFIYYLIDFIFYLSYINETIKQRDQFNPDPFGPQYDNMTDYLSQEREILVSSFLFNVFQFVFVTILFSGIYVELTNKFAKITRELYPKA